MPDDLKERIAVLERRSRWLRHAVVGLALLWSATVAGVVTLVRTPVTLTAAQPGPDGILRVRGLIVEDGRGTPRVQIGAPLPDPPVLGKRISRGGTAHGILIFDAEGNERGGYATFDESGIAVMTLDEIGSMVAQLSAGPTGGGHLWLRNRDSEIRLGGAESGSYVRMRDSRGNLLLTPATPARQP
jgi:hypothetical protein